MNDLVLFGTFTVLRNLSPILSYAKSIDEHTLQVAAGIIVASGFAYFQLWTYIRKAPVRKDGLQDGPKPLFFPSSTSHTRFFPKVHSFSYSYLLTGVPIGWEGSAGGMIGVSNERPGSQNSGKSSSWYTIKAEDHLERGYGYLGLQGKLRKHLDSQEIRHEDYPYAYLLTAATFLGYSFNPVSFWYLYSAERELTAMVLEVNNTFGERRMYFLKPDSSPVESVEDTKTDENTDIIPSDSATSAKPKRFTNTWPKDFHVSPFNSRKGTYSLIAYDPFSTNPKSSAVNNTITLSSSKAHSKLVARIFSTSAPIDPSTMTIFQKATFLLSWWWVGLVTFPRIVREAGKLFFHRKLHVWFRPEPLKESMSRAATVNEAALEAVFRKYLRHLVESASIPIIVKYWPAGIAGGDEIMTSSLAATASSAPQASHPKPETLEFKVLTPIFYPRFTAYAHDLEALFSESTESPTLSLSRPDLLPQLVLKKPLPTQHVTGWVNSMLFPIIQKMRKRPARVEAGPVRSSDSSKEKKKELEVGKRKVTTVDIRTFRPSPMDAFVLSHLSPSEQASYRIEALKGFLSRHIAFGDVGILDAEVWMMKSAGLWVLAGWVGGLVAGIVMK